MNGSNLRTVRVFFKKIFGISKYEGIQDLSWTKNQGHVSNLHFILPKCNNKFNGSKQQAKQPSLSTDQQHWKPIIYKWKEESYFLETIVVSKKKNPPQPT